MTRNSLPATLKFTVVPRENPPDIYLSSHESKEAAEAAADEAPHDCYVRPVWAGDEAAATKLIDDMEPGLPSDVQLTPGRRHWDEIAEWRDGAPLTTTIRVDVGPTTGVAEPTRDAVTSEIAAQRRGHQELPPDTPEPWYLTEDERR